MSIKKISKYAVRSQKSPSTLGELTDEIEKMIKKEKEKAIAKEYKNETVYEPHESDDSDFDDSCSDEDSEEDEELKKKQEELKKKQEELNKKRNVAIEKRTRRVEKKRANKRQLEMMLNPNYRAGIKSESGGAKGEEKTRSLSSNTTTLKSASKKVHDQGLYPTCANYALATSIRTCYSWIEEKLPNCQPNGIPLKDFDDYDMLVNVCKKNNTKGNANSTWEGTQMEGTIDTLKKYHLDLFYSSKKEVMYILNQKIGASVIVGWSMNPYIRMVFKVYFKYRIIVAEEATRLGKLQWLIELEKKHDNVINKENRTKEEEEEFAFVEKLYQHVDKKLNIKIGFCVNRWIFNKGWIYNVDLSRYSGELDFDGHSKHAISLHGFNDKSDIPYWKLKNSWGSKEGEVGDGGFIRFEMGIFDDICENAKELYKNLNSNQLSEKFKCFKLPKNEIFLDKMKGLPFHSLFISEGRMSSHNPLMDYYNPRHNNPNKSMFFERFEEGKYVTTSRLQFRVIIPMDVIYNCASGDLKIKIEQTLNKINTRKIENKKKLINIYKKYLNSIIRYRIKSFQTNISNSVFKSVVAPRERDDDYLIQDAKETEIEFYDGMTLFIVDIVKETEWEIELRRLKKKKRVAEDRWWDVADDTNTTVVETKGEEVASASQLYDIYSDIKMEIQNYELTRPLVDVYTSQLSVPPEKRNKYWWFPEEDFFMQLKREVVNEDIPLNQMGEILSSINIYHPYKMSRVLNDESVNTIPMSIDYDDYNKLTIRTFFEKIITSDTFKFGYNMNLLYDETEIEENQRQEREKEEMRALSQSMMNEARENNPENYTLHHARDFFTGTTTDPGDAIEYIAMSDPLVNHRLNYLSKWGIYIPFKIKMLENVDDYKSMLENIFVDGVLPEIHDTKLKNIFSEPNTWHTLQKWKIKPLAKMIEGGKKKRKTRRKRKYKRKTKRAKKKKDSKYRKKTHKTHKRTTQKRK